VKKFLNIFLTGFAAFFSIPTILILASWNAIPGESLYSIKTGLEDVVLTLTINTPLASAFSVNFTDRRYTEATKLLAKEGSSVGYELLVAEAQQTQNIVIKKKDVKNGAQLINKIEEYQTQIQEKKVEIQTQAANQPSSVTTPKAATPAPTPVTIQQPTTPAPSTEEKQTVIINKPTEVVIEEEEPEEVIDNLEDTIDELEEIKEEVEQQLPETTQHWQGQNQAKETPPKEEPVQEEESKSEPKNNWPRWPGRRF
jgi:hypothetical protein